MPVLSLLFMPKFSAQSVLLFSHRLSSCAFIYIVDLAINYTRLLHPGLDCGCRTAQHASIVKQDPPLSLLPFRNPKKRMNKDGMIAHQMFYLYYPSISTQGNKDNNSICQSLLGCLRRILRRLAASVPHGFLLPHSCSTWFWHTALGSA